MWKILSIVAISSLFLVLAQVTTADEANELTQAMEEGGLHDSGVKTRVARQSNSQKGGNSQNDDQDGLPGPKGSQGKQGRRGQQGPQGSRGQRGQRGARGSQGLQGTVGATGARGSSGTTYVRWGRSVCPGSAEAIYSGIASGSKYNLGGGTDETLCLPDDPEYYDGETVSLYVGTLWGVRYEVYQSATTAKLGKRQGQKMPCVVCYSSNASTILTIPAKYSCPTSWNLEYNGYLMSEGVTSYRPRKDTICADRVGESAGSYTPYPSVNYLMNVNCDEGIACPPYASNKPLSCAVCSR